MIYLDNAATTRPAAEVIENFTKVSEEAWGNASSTTYEFGARAARLLDEARGIVAECIGAEPRQVIFTSGSTEGANMVIQGQIPRGDERNWCIVTTTMEHPCIYNTVRHMGEAGVAVVELDEPMVSLVELVTAVARYTDDYEHVLMCIMDTNNETGATQPSAEIGALADAYPNMKYLCDITQSIAHGGGINVQKMHLDYAIASAHKFGGLKGVGFLYVRDPDNFKPLMYGGHQEFGLRPGTENVAGIWSMALQLKHVCTVRTNMLELGNMIIERLSGELKDYTYCAPNIISLTFSGVDAAKLMTMLDMDGICVSAGSACSSGEATPSRVLKALGYSDEDAFATIRVSFDEDTTEEDVAALCDSVEKNIEWARREEE